MRANYSKRVLLYGQVRRALQSGRYVPGERIDPTTLAAEFNTSPTPVRFALYRLVGEGMIADHARAGLHVPLPTEVAMRDLYDWMHRLLVMACELGPSPLGGTSAETARPASPGDDVVKRTWQLFDAIARVTAHHPLHRAVKQANDRLAPIRRAKHALIEDAFEEFAELDRHWRKRDMAALKAALHGYHERRRRLVPCIVALLSEGRDQLH